MPLVSRIRLAHLPHPFDEESGIRKSVRVVLKRTVFGVKRHGESAPLARIRDGPALEPRVFDEKRT